MVGTQPEAEIQDGALDFFLSFTLAGSRDRTVPWHLDETSFLCVEVGPARKLPESAKCKVRGEGVKARRKLIGAMGLPL